MRFFLKLLVAFFIVSFPLSVYAKEIPFIEFYGDNFLKNLYIVESQHFSGSGQITRYNIDTLKHITRKKIIVVDLRDDIHGFVNGESISFGKVTNLNNILSTEEKTLKSISKNKLFTFYNKDSFSCIVKSVESEKSLVLTNSMKYIRFPVSSNIPDYTTLSKFKEVINSFPKNYHIHFHCDNGYAKTATYMILYDMLKNNNDKFEDIINRNKNSYMLDENHMNFLKLFYEKGRLN